MVSSYCHSGARLQSSNDCHLTVKYKGFDDIFEVQLMEDQKNQCAKILGKANEKCLKQMKITRCP